MGEFLVSGINPQETNIGSTTKLVFWPRSIRPKKFSLRSRHAVALQDEALTGKQHQRQFWLGVDGINKKVTYALNGIQGAVKKVTTYTLNGVVADDTCVVGNDTLVFKAVPADELDVELGASDAESATNLANKIIARTGSTLSTATAEDEVVTVTANTAGVTYTSTGSTHITVEQITANIVGSSCVCGGDTFKFVVEPVLATDVDPGESDEDAATNLAAKITSRSVTSLATAEAEGAVVTAESASLGVTFVATGDAHIVVTQLQAATAAVGAWKEITFGGKVFVKDGRNAHAWSMEINEKKDVLFVIFPTPANADRVKLATGMKTNYTAALAGNKPATGAVFSLFGASRAQIKAALRSLVGTDANTAFTLPEAGKFRINLLPSLGAEGNAYQSRVALLPTPPNIKFKITDDGTISIEGIGTGIQPGVTKGFKFNENPTAGSLDGDDFLVTFLDSITGLKGEGEFTLQQSESAHWQSIFAAGTGLTFDESYDIATPGGNTVIETWGIAAIQESKKVPGQFNIRFIWEAQFLGGLQQALDKTGAGLPIKFTAAGDDSAAPHGATYFFREFDE